jgi:hypothetical protein
MFNVYRNKYRAAAGLLAVMLAFCLVLGSVPFAAEAAESLTVSPASSNAGAESNYNFTASGLNLAAGDVAGKGLDVVFPSGFVVSSSPAVEVGVTVNGEVYYAYVAPVVDSINSPYKATLTVPASIGLPQGGIVTAVSVKGLVVTNTTTAGSYSVSLTFTGPEPDKTLTQQITINPVVGNVTLTSPTTDPTGTAGSQVSVLVKGEVKDVAGQPYSGIGVNFSAKDPQESNVTLTVSPSSVTTMADGTFAATVQFTPTKAGTYTVMVSAGGESATFNVVVNPAAAAKLVWVSPPTSSISLTGRTALTVQLQDQYGNAVNAPTDGVAVDLAAFDPTTKAMAGRFYNAATGGSEITSVTIPAGSNNDTVYLEPLAAAAGKIIKVEARAASLTVASANISVGAAPTPPSTITLAASISGVAGYVQKVKVGLDKVADQDYTLTVNLLDEDGNAATWATWDTNKNTAYQATGSKSDRDTFTFSAGEQEMYIYVYTTADAAGKTLTVKVSGIGESEGSASISYAAGMGRSLNKGWNILATPLELAGDGNLAFLLGADASKVLAAYTYDNGDWVLVTDQKLEPLKGYFVKMADDGTAQFSFKNATSPSEIIPKSRALVAGWNLVGVSKATGERLTVANILANVAGKYTTVVNPGLGNTEEWSACTPESAGGKYVGDGDAYWVYMTQPGTINALAVPNLVAE